MVFMADCIRQNETKEEYSEVFIVFSYLYSFMLIFFKCLTFMKLSEKKNKSNKNVRQTRNT